MRHVSGGARSGRQRGEHVRARRLLAALPAPAEGTEVRVLATNDMLGSTVPLPATHGAGGSIPGIARLLERQRATMPAIWLDSGDLTVGGASGMWGHKALLELGPLPIGAAAVGNHELDEGPDMLARFAAELGFPLLCVDRDVGLPACTVIDTPRGEVGVLGVTHPLAHELALAPKPAHTWSERIAECATSLRRDGARWVVALLHDGVTWWSDTGDGQPIGTRCGRLHAVAKDWARLVDAVLCGHTLAAWTGALHGTPAGQAHAFAATVLAVDLCARTPSATIHPPVRVPSVQPSRATPTVEAIRCAASRKVGELHGDWSSRPGAPRYLPNLVAAAIRSAGGAEAGFVPPGQLFTQAPIDGVVASLRDGSVTELDLHRLFPFSDDEIVIAELEPRDFRRLIDTHDGASDRHNKASDAAWWNWLRAPAGIASSVEDPATVAVAAFLLPLLRRWLGRDLAAHPSSTGGRRAVQLEINR